MEPVLHHLVIGHLDEQHPAPAVRREDHALFVAGPVGVQRILAEAEHLAPPDRLRVGVARVDTCVRDP